MAPRQSFFQRHRQRLIIFGGIGAGLILLTLIGLAGFYWFAVPKLAEDALRERLASLKQDAGLDITTGKITPDGVQGLIVEDFALTPQGADAPLLEVKRVAVTMHRARLLAGQKAIAKLDVSGVTIRLHRDARGQLNLQDLANQLKRAREQDKHDASDDTPDDSAGGDLNARAKRALRYFGDEFPELAAREVTVLFTSETPEHAFPLSKLSVPSATLTGGSSADVAATIHLEAPSPPAGWQLPTQLTLGGQLTLPLEETALTLTMDRPLLLEGLPKLPELRVGLSGLTLEPGPVARVEGLSLQPTFAPDDAPPLLSVASAEIALAAWVTKPDALRITRARITQPHLQLSVDAQDADALRTLLTVHRAEAAAHLEAQAQEVAAAMRALSPAALAQGATPQATSPKGAQLSSGQRLMIAMDKWLRILPAETTITDAQISLHDARALPVTRPATLWRARDGELTLTHDADNGALALSASVAGEAGAPGELKPRGTASLDAALNYGRGQLSVTLKADALDLSWLAQLAGPRVAQKLRGGTLDATLKLDRPDRKSHLGFEGDIKLTRGYLVMPKLAEDPLDGWTASYSFAGRYDSKASIPAPKLGKQPQAADADVALDEVATVAAVEAPPKRGALIFTRGEATLGGVSASVKPAIYGIEGRRKPARVDLDLDMPKTSAQTILDSIPPALLGELVGTKVRGDVTWKMHLEAPLYDMRDLAWDGEPEVKDFAIISIAQSMDVRKLTERFSLTIEDEPVQFRRTISIPAMTLTDANYLIENARLTPEEVDAHWQRGEWFSPPETDAWGAQRRTGPSYWTSDHARRQAPPLPWAGGDDEPIVRRWKPFKEDQQKPMVSEPYGPYVYVPLQHISPYLVRAILTTEDNSFFKHSGFNRLALRESIARNMREGEFVRGASTISMQLVKNVFLSRRKVMARKIQEALLVWAMESVVQVPKARLLEIYLNVIEFAPGVFGIHDAAVHYFGKRPDALTLAEATWLVTIVPGPKKYHFYYERGEITESYFNRMKRYLRIIFTRERVTELEYQEAIATKPTFYKPLGDSAPGLKPEPEPALDDLWLDPTPFEPQAPPTLLPAPTPTLIRAPQPSPQGSP